VDKAYSRRAYPFEKKGGMGIRITEITSGEDQYKDLCTRQKKLLENDE